MTDNNLPSGETYEERIRQWEKEKKGILGDLQGEREKRHAVEERLRVIEESLTSAANEDGETPETRVNRLAQDPDGYISNHLAQFEQERVKPLQQEIQMMKMDRQIERGLRWVARQEKKDYEEVVGSDLEQDLARLTMDMRNRGIIPTNPEEGTKEAYRLLLDERKEKENREKVRDEKIQGNRTESVSTPPRSNSQRWTREEVAALSIDEFNKNEPEIRKAAASWQ